MAKLETDFSENPALTPEVASADDLPRLLDEWRRARDEWQRASDTYQLETHGKGNADDPPEVEAIWQRRMALEASIASARATTIAGIMAKVAFVAEDAQEDYCPVHAQAIATAVAAFDELG